MKIAELHRWPRAPSAALKLQRELAARVRVDRPAQVPELPLVAGVDCAFSPDGRFVIAGVVIWSASERRVIEQVVVRRRCSFPYVPGLLSFRELPAVLAALAKVKTAPDIVLCDAQGIAHPRGIGLASHLGLWLGVPTVGCAKSRLCGEHGEPGRRRGSRSRLMLNGRCVGAAVRTRDGVRPLFVSPGHLCDVESAVRLTLACGDGYRLPAPTRLAHALVTWQRMAHARESSSRTDTRS